jgi:hypothetical protein
VPAPPTGGKRACRTGKTFVVKREKKKERERERERKESNKVKKLELNEKEKNEIYINHQGCSNYILFLYSYNVYT